jgi:hypothetical protein
MVSAGAGLAAAAAGASGFASAPHPFQVAALGAAATLSAGLALQASQADDPKKKHLPLVLAKSTILMHLD